MSDYHVSVLLQEGIDALLVREGGRYIDATLGGGGHAQEILRRDGKVLGIDFDKEAIDNAKKIFAKEENIKFVKGNFNIIDEIAGKNGFIDVNGIIFDLGMSSHQVNKANRGFSYLKEGPLDMRMDQDLTIKASDLLKVLTKGELYEVFNKFGEETRAKPISNSIVSARRVKSIETTNDLVEILKDVYKVRGDSNFMKAKISKKVFQALRMAVNDEIGNLRDALPRSYKALARGGRIVVISFHSLEDRVVKKTFIDMENAGFGKIITKKPIAPSFVEIKANPRSKSAKLRVFEKGN